MRKSIIACAVLALMQVPGVSTGGEGAASIPRGLSPGGKVPGFSARNLRGESLELGELLRKYRVVLVNFWGIRCGSCIEEMPHLNAISAKYPDRVAVLGVNTDGADAETLSGLLQKSGLEIRYEVVPDPDFRLVELFGMTAAPLTFLIGPDGILTYRHEGYASGDEKTLGEAVASLLR